LEAEEYIRAKFLFQIGKRQLARTTSPFSNKYIEILTYAESSFTPNSRSSKTFDYVTATDIPTHQFRKTNYLYMKLFYVLFLLYVRKLSPMTLPLITIIIITPSIGYVTRQWRRLNTSQSNSPDIQTIAIDQRPRYARTFSLPLHSDRHPTRREITHKAPQCIAE